MQMLSYEMFLECVKNELIHYFPKRYEDWKIVITKKAKVNGVGDAILIKGDRSFGAIPAIYVQDLYQEYLEEKSVPVILTHCAEVLTQALDEKGKGEDVADAAFHALVNPKERIVFRLVNTALNEELLKTVPHRSFLDLSLVYHIEINGGAIRIDHEIADRIGYSEKALYQTAIKNNRERRPYEIETMKDMILRLIGIPGLEDMTEAEKNEALSFLGVGPEQIPMWCLSNKGNRHGFTGALYEEVLEGVAEVVKGDYYVVPSSVHEAVIVRVGDIGLEVAKGLLHDISNEENLEPGEYLSDQVYVYRLSAGRLEIAE